MRLLARIVVCLAVTFTLAGCAKSAIVADDGSVESEGDGADWLADDEPKAASTRDAASRESGAHDAGKDVFEAGQSREAEPDASEAVADAESAKPDAAQVAQTPRDAAIAAVQDASVTAPPFFYDAGTTVPSPNTCSAAACGSCPGLATPCCSLLGTCACRLSLGPCILPPLPSFP